MCRRRRKRVLSLILFVVFGSVAETASAQSGSYDIRSAIQTAISNNYSLKADSLNLRMADEKKKEVKAGYLPQANFTTQSEYNPAIASQLLPGSVIGQPNKDYVGVKFGTRYNMRAGVEVTQALYRKDLKLQVKNAALQKGIESSKFNLSKEELVYQVATSFYSLQAYAEMLRTNNRDYTNMKGVLAIAQAQYDNGVLKKIDLQSLQINVANLLSNIQQLQTNYDEQLTRFNYLLGLPAAAKTVIADTITAGTGQAEIRGGIFQREDIRLSRQLIESKEVEMNAIRAESKPSVNSYFRYYYNSQFNDPGKAFNGDYSYRSSTVGVTMTVPILDGNRRKSRVNTARLQLEQLKLQDNQKLEQAHMEQASAALTFGNNQEQVAITRHNLALAMDVFTARRELYAQGVSSLMELLEAEKELSNADNLHIQALIDLQTARLDMHKANGSLLTDFINTL